MILHRGNIGGGRLGIGKNLLMDKSYLRTEVLDGTNEKEMLLVGELRSKLFESQLKHFVEDVHRVKETTVAGKMSAATKSSLGLSPSLFEMVSSGFTNETAGIINLSPSKNRILHRTHGLVVGALAKSLEQHFKGTNWQVYNDRHRDLMLIGDNEVSVLFEIKTTVTIQTIATALGQLLLYGVSALEPLRRVLVLPERLDSKVERHLNAWHIECLYFDWLDNKVRFSKLPVFLASCSTPQKLDS